MNASRLPVSVAPGLAYWRRPIIGFQWLFLRSGLGATNHFEAGGFVRSNDDVAYPNLMFHFLPIAVRYDGSAAVEGHGFQIHTGPMRSPTRGTVRLASSDPAADPAILDRAAPAIQAVSKTIHRVGTAPGMMQLTRIRGPSSLAKVRVSMFTPALAAL